MAGLALGDDKKAISIIKDELKKNNLILEEERFKEISEEIITILLRIGGLYNDENNDLEMTSIIRFSPQSWPQTYYYMWGVGHLVYRVQGRRPDDSCSRLRRL